MRKGNVYTITKGKEKAIFFTPEEVIDALESMFPKLEEKRIKLKSLFKTHDMSQELAATYENLNS